MDKLPDNPELPVNPLPDVLDDPMPDDLDPPTGQSPDVPEPPDEISTTKYQHLMLNDQVHLRIMEVLAETRITFPLSDFQLVSLHVLGNKLNLILISPTGSGKMLGKYNIHF